jgi:aminotransferase
MADIGRLAGRNSKERAMSLLAATGVACVPGEAFFQDGGGETLARFAYAKPRETLDEACRRIESLAVLQR